jgi:hypothetical protein
MSDRSLEVVLTARDNVSDILEKVAQSLRSTGESASVSFTGAGRAAESGAESIGRASQSSVTSLAGIEQMSMRLVERLTELFAIHEITEFVGHVVEAGAKFADLSAKTGVSITYLEQIKPVADKSGSSVDEFGQAIYRMGNNIQEGTTKTQDGLALLAEATGDQALAWRNLKDLSPEEQFKDIITALSGMEDQQRANAIGTMIFGRQFQSMAASVHDGTLQMAADVKVAGEEHVKALKAASDAWVDFKDKAQDASVSGLGAFILAAQRMHQNGIVATLNEGGHALDGISPTLKNQLLLWYGPEGLLTGLAAAAAGYQAVGKAAAEQRDAVPLDDDTERAQKAAAFKTAIDLLDSSLRDNDAVLSHLTGAVRAHMESEIAAGATAKQLVDAYGITDASATKLIETHKKAAEAAKKLADQTDAANQALSLNGAVLEQVVPHYQQVVDLLATHGASEEDIAAKTGATIPQIKAVAEAEKQRAENAKLEYRDMKQEFDRFTKGLEQGYEAEEKAADAAEAARVEATFKGNAVALGAEQKFSDQQTAIGTTTFEQKRAAIVEWTNQQLNQLGTDDKNYDAHADRIVSIQHQMIAALGPPWASMVNDIGAGLQNMASLGGQAFTVIGQSAMGAANGISAIVAGHKTMDAAAAKNSLGGELNGILGMAGGIASLATTFISLGQSIYHAFHNTDGRDAIVAFANDNGGFESLHAKLLDSGAAGEEMWKKLAGVGEGNAAQAKETIAEATALLKKQDDATLKLQQDQDDQKTAFQQLQGDISKYKVGVDQLGPAWKQQNLTAEAEDLIGSYERLTHAGVQTGDVIKDMAGLVVDANGKVTGFSGGLNQLANDAISTGAILPKQFEPILKQMADAGELVDGAGNQIKDLSKINFGDTLTDQFQKLIDKEDTLIDRLTAYLTLTGGFDFTGATGQPTSATTAAPGPQGPNQSDGTRPTSPAPAGPSAPPSAPSSGGDSDSLHVGGRAAGGIYATGASGVATWFGEAGAPELGGPVDFMSDVLAKAMLQSRAGSDTYHVTINAKTDDPRELARVFIAEVQNNRGGARTAMRTALDV